MLAIRMQRTGRRGHAQFRLIVQDKRFSPTSGRVVAFLGSYDPHSKVVKLDTAAAKAYLDNGAQPTDRVAVLLKKEGIQMPAWVKPQSPKKRAIKNPEKLRRNRPDEPKPEPTAEAEAPVAVSSEDQPVSEPAVEEAQAETPEVETPVKETATETAPVEEIAVTEPETKFLS